MNQPAPPSMKEMMTGWSAPSASFDDRPPPRGKGIPLNTYYEGTVIKEEIVQSTKMPERTGDEPELEFWDKEKTRPKWQVILTVTNPAYVTDENPDGQMRIFLKGGALQAAQQTWRDQGVDTALHGFCRLTWVGTKPASNPNFADAKVFEFQFAPGVAPQQREAFQGQPQQQPVQQGAVAQTQFPPAAVAAQQPGAFTAPQVTQQQAPPPFNPPAGNAGAPGHPQTTDPAAALGSILGAVEITPLDPTTTEQVRQLMAAGYTDAPTILAAFATYPHLPQPTAAQVQQVIENTPI